MPIVGFDLGAGFDRQVYRCAICGLCFDNDREGDRHLRLIHPEIFARRWIMETDTIAETKQLLDAAIQGSGERLLPFFTFSQLPPKLQQVSAEFARLAVHIVGTLPTNPERTVALRKLLESKDCAVRAAL